VALSADCCSAAQSRRLSDLAVKELTLGDEFGRESSAA
jgi:hypothetical protein